MTKIKQTQVDPEDLTKESPKKEIRLPNPNEKIMQDSRDIDLECPLCKAKVNIYNRIMITGAKPITEGSEFKVAFRQIFYDVICTKCGVKAMPIKREENK